MACLSRQVIDGVSKSTTLTKFGKHFKIKAKLGLLFAFSKAFGFFVLKHLCQLLADISTLSPDVCCSKNIVWHTGKY